MTALRLGYALGFPLLVGLGLVRALPAVWGSRPLRWGAAFGLGSGLLTVEMFAFALLGLPWDPLGLSVLPALCAVIAVMRGRRRGDTAGYPTALAASRGRRAFRIGLTLILLMLIGGTFLKAALVPLSTWDGFAIWGFKGKAFYADGAVSEAFFSEPTRGYSHLDYPVHLPLLMAWIALILEQWHDALVMLLFPVFYASLLLMVYGALARQGAPEIALAFTAGLGSVPQLLDHASAAMADLPLAYYLAASVALLLLHLERSEGSALLAAALMGGMAGWTKNEGLALFGIAACWLGAWTATPDSRWRRPLRTTLIYLAIGGMVVLPWVGWRWYLGLGTDVLPGGRWLSNLGEAPGRLALILTALAAEAGRVPRWNLLWPLFLLASVTILWLRPVRSAHRYAAVVWSALGVYTLIYLVTERNLPWLLSTSLDRLLLHLAPLAVLAIGSAAPSAEQAERLHVPQVRGHDERPVAV